MDRIVKANIYLTDLPNDFAPMNEVYAEVCSDTFATRLILLIRTIPVLPKGQDAREDLHRS